MARKKSDFSPRVEFVPVESSGIVAEDFDSGAALHEWLLHLDGENGRLAGAFVRVRARVETGFAFGPAEVRAALLAAGARDARVSLEHVPESRKERVEGLASLPSRRQRLARYLESVYPSEWDENGGKLHPVAIEVLRVFEGVERCD